MDTVQRAKAIKFTSSFARFKSNGNGTPLVLIIIIIGMQYKKFCTADKQSFKNVLQTVLPPEVVKNLVLSKHRSLWVVPDATDTNYILSGIIHK